MNFAGINRLPNVGQGRRLAEMKQEDPDMMKALEEDLMDFHGRIEESSTWWCPRMQDTTTTTKKKVVAARINFQSHHPRMLNQKCVKFHAQVTSHPPVTLYVGDIPPGLNEQGLRHTFQPYGDLLSVNIIRYKGTGGKYSQGFKTLISSGPGIE